MEKRHKPRLKKMLDWQRMDIENRLGFSAGKYTDPNIALTIVSAGILWTCFYGLAIWFEDSLQLDIFLNRGITPYFILYFSFCCLAILLVKWRKLSLQIKALELMVVPQAKTFELTTNTAKDILERIYGLVDDPKNFTLLNRIERALSNLNNIGMIADISEILSVQSQNDEDQMESSYALIKGFIWAIPVLGFIGTVLGLSKAISKFGAVLGSQGLSGLKLSIQKVTSGLSIAFDTTLIALTAALMIQLICTGLKKKEERFLDECKDYCHLYIISKLRLDHPQRGNPPIMKV